MGGGDANEVVRAAEPSSAGQVVVPVRVAPGATGAGEIPVAGNVVDVGAAVVVGDFEDEPFDPRNAPNVESTTRMAIAPAASCRRRRAFCIRAAVAACAFSRLCSR